MIKPQMNTDKYGSEGTEGKAAEGVLNGSHSILILILIRGSPCSSVADFSIAISVGRNFALTAQH